MEQEPVPTSCIEDIGEVRISSRYLARQERYRRTREITEEEYWQDIIKAIEAVTGPLLDWQKVYAIAAISGRGVEWTQTRRGPHYHIVGVPCPVCGRK